MAQPKSAVARNELKRKKPASALLDALRNSRLGKIARSNTLSLISLRLRVSARHRMATQSALSRDASENCAGVSSIVAIFWPTNDNAACGISRRLDRLICYARADQGWRS